MGQYSKALVALAGLLVVFASVLADGILASDEVETVAFAAITAVGVYLKKNDPAPLPIARNVGG